MALTTFGSLGNVDAAWQNIGYDPNNGLMFVVIDGQPNYYEPARSAQAQTAAAQMGLPVPPAPSQDQIVQRIQGEGYDSGGFWENPTDQWDAKTGTYKGGGFNWKMLEGLGGIAAGGVISAFSGGGAIPEVATEAGGGGLPEGVTLEGVSAGLDGAGATTVPGALLPSTTVGSGMATLPGGAASGLLDAGAMGEAGALLPSTQIGNGMVSGLEQGTTGADISGGDVWNGAGDFLGNGEESGSYDGGSVLGKIGKYAKLMRGAGKGISDATDAADNRRLAFSDPYIKRGKLEMEQRNQALKDLYLADSAMHPSHSPFDPVAARVPGGAYAAALGNISTQDAARLAKPPAYDVANMPSLQPGTLEKIGQWAGPLLSILGGLGDNSSGLPPWVMS